MIIDIELALIHANRQTHDFLFRTLNYLHNFVLIVGLKTFKTGFLFKIYLLMWVASLQCLLWRKLNEINVRNEHTTGSSIFSTDPSRIFFF